MDRSAHRPLPAALAALAAVLACSAAPLAGSAQAAATTACTRARVGPAIKCLAVGKRCDPRYEHVYKTYAFVCFRPAGHRHYQLRARLYIGPPLP